MKCYSQARETGYKAYFVGLDLQDNPFQILRQTIEYTDWLIGWHDAEFDLKFSIVAFMSFWDSF